MNALTFIKQFSATNSLGPKTARERAEYDTMLRWLRLLRRIAGARYAAYCSGSCASGHLREAAIDVHSDLNEIIGWRKALAAYQQHMSRQCPAFEMPWLVFINAVTFGVPSMQPGRPKLTAEEAARFLWLFKNELLLDDFLDCFCTCEHDDDEDEHEDEPQLRLCYDT